jgi:hypothetical protein
MLKAPVPSITVVKQHWAQSVLGWVTAYKRVNHTKDWLALLLARCWSHREEGIKKHTPSAWRVALWDPSVGSGPNSAGSVWPAGNNGHASLRDAWKQNKNNNKTVEKYGLKRCQIKQFPPTSMLWWISNEVRNYLFKHSLGLAWGVFKHSLAMNQNCVQFSSRVLFFYTDICLTFERHSDYRTVSHYWVLLVYVAFIRAVWADDGDKPLLFWRNEKLFEIGSKSAFWAHKTQYLRNKCSKSQ